MKNSGKILMQSAPKGVDLDDVKHDLEQVSVACNVLQSLDCLPAYSPNEDVTPYMDQTLFISEGVVSL